MKLKSTYIQQEKAKEKLSAHISKLILLTVYQNNFEKQQYQVGTQI